MRIYLIAILAVQCISSWLVWWNPLTWIDETALLTFSLLTKPFNRWSFASRIKRRIKEELQKNTEQFLDDQTIDKLCQHLQDLII